MRHLANKAKLLVVLAITTVCVVFGVLNLRDRLSLRSVADDGIEWVDTTSGVQAKSVRPESPLYYRVKKGDYVRAIFYRGKYEEVQRVEDLARYLDNISLNGEARYTIYHPYKQLQRIYRIDEPLYDIDFKPIALTENLSRGLYLAFIGFVYLAIGLFVLFKQ